MQFNSVKGGNFTSAAKSLNKSTEAIFDASRTSAPDFTGISKQAMVSRAKERNAATEAKGLVERSQIKADSLIDRTKIKVKSDKDVASAKRPAKRMAGVVAGLGSLATGAVMGITSKADKAEEAKRSAAWDARTAAYLKLADRKTEPWKPTAYKSEPLPELETADLSKIGTDTSTTKPEGGTSTPLKSTLTGDAETVASYVRSVEGGEFGYQAFNQFGDDGGHSNRGTGGNYGTKFGTNLTDMTITQVMEKGSRHNDSSLSDEEWQKSGGIWAAGAYQFIPETLKGVVKRSGIDPSRKFDQSAQDELFKFHAKETGNLTPWVGVTKEKAGQLNPLILNF